MNNQTPKQIKAENAYFTLLVYAQRVGKESDNTDEKIKTLLCDIMHLSDEYGVDFDKEIINAKAAYDEDLAVGS
jgi:hypothetical protein